MSDLNEWAKLDITWYQQSELDAAADECEAAFIMWPVLIAKAKEKSHATRNPDGAISISARRLSADARCDVADIGAALDALASVGLLSYSAEGDRRLTITLNGFARWQSPRGSAADRKARQRAKVTTVSPVGHSDVTPMSQVRHTDVTPVSQVVPNVSHREEGEEKRVEGEGDKKTPSPSPTGGGDDRVGVVTARQSNPKGEYSRARGELGRLAMVVEMMIGTAESDRGKSIPLERQLRDYYRPAVKLLAEFGAERLSHALAETRERGGTSMSYVETVCRSSSRQATQEAKRPKRPIQGDPAANLKASREPRVTRPATLADLGIPEVGT